MIDCLGALRRLRAHEPPFKAATRLLWVGPFALLLAGAGWLAWRLRGAAARSPPRALSAADRETARVRRSPAGTPPRIPHPQVPQVTAFLVFAGLLVAGALLLILPPLLGYGRRSQAQMRQSAMVLTVLREQLADLDAELAEGASTPRPMRRAAGSSAVPSRRPRWPPRRPTAPTAGRRPGRVATGLAIPALAVGTYLMIGEPPRSTRRTSRGQQGFTQEQVTEMVGSLEKHRRQPRQRRGWAMLAHLPGAEGLPQGCRRLRTPSTSCPQQPDVLSDWADVVAAQTGKVRATPRRWCCVRSWRNQKHPRRWRWLAPLPPARRLRRRCRLLGTHPRPDSPGDDVAGAACARASTRRAPANMAPLAAAATAPHRPPRSGRRPPAGRRRARRPGRAEDAVFVFVRGEAGGPCSRRFALQGSRLPVNFDFDGAMLMMGDAPVPERIVSRRASPRVAMPPHALATWRASAPRWRRTPTA